MSVTWRHPACSSYEHDGQSVVLNAQLLHSVARCDQAFQQHSATLWRYHICHTVRLRLSNIEDS